MYLIKNFQKRGEGHGWGVKICDFARESQKKTKKKFAFFCKNNSILRNFLVKFRFERSVLSSAKRAQNKHKKNWRTQAKLLDALSNDIMQRLSPRGRPWPPRRPRGHILKSLASKPHFLENCPVFCSRTALFFELLKFCTSPTIFFGRRFFLEIAWKNFLKIFFFKNTCACVLGNWFANWRTFLQKPLAI